MARFRILTASASTLTHPAFVLPPCLSTPPSSSSWRTLYADDAARSVILGRAIKNEYLALGTIFSAVSIGMLASGGKKETPAPSAGKSVLEQAKESVKFNAGSRCVEAESYFITF